MFTGPRGSTNSSIDIRDQIRQARVVIGILKENLSEKFKSLLKEDAKQYLYVEKNLIEI